MLPLTSLHSHTTSPLFFRHTTTKPHQHHLTCPKPQFRRTQLAIQAISNSSQFQFNKSDKQNQQPRTLFPGGYKRPEIKVPNIVLRVEASEVFGNGDVLDLVDKAVAKCVGIVVLDGGEESGGKLYEAACSLKSVIKDRAYLLVAERVDIAAAVNASGVLLSDQGLPAIVARNMMIGSNTESVVLPLVGRIVKTEKAALSASSSEGADFLIYEIAEARNIDGGPISVLDNVKIPIFISCTSAGESMSVSEASKLFGSGASGLTISLGDLRLLSDDVWSKLLIGVYGRTERMAGEVENLDRLRLADIGNGFPGAKDSLKELRDKEKRFIERERSILLKAINVIKKAAPLVIF